MLDPGRYGRSSLIAGLVAREACSLDPAMNVGRPYPKAMGYPRK
jgi:hypothetical protein